MTRSKLPEVRSEAQLTSLPSVKELKQAHRSWSPLIEAESYFLFFSLHPLSRLRLNICEPTLPVGNDAHATSGFHSFQSKCLEVR